MEIYSFKMPNKTNPTIFTQFTLKMTINLRGKLSIYLAHHFE